MCGALERVVEQVKFILQMDPEWNVRKAIETFLVNKGCDLKETNIELGVLECWPPIYEAEIVTKNKRIVIHGSSWGDVCEQLEKEYQSS